MKERLSETQLPSASPSRSSTTTKVQRLYTMWVAAVVTVAVIPPPYCHGYSVSYRSSPSASRNALLLERRPVLPAGLWPLAHPLEDRYTQSSTSSSSSSSIVMSLQDLQMQQPPIMFLHPRSVSSSLTTSSSSTSTRDRTRPPADSPEQIRIASSDTHAQPPRVLGFDISSSLMSSSTALQATRKRQSNVNVNIETWNGKGVVVDDDLNFFPSPTKGGFLWNSNHAQSKQQQQQQQQVPLKFWNDETATVAPTTVLPLWFPWIPTKLQIQELKVTELRQALVQRGLKKVCDTSTPTNEMYVCVCGDGQYP
jgi:hypothetical protein